MAAATAVAGVNPWMTAASLALPVIGGLFGSSERGNKANYAVQDYSQSNPLRMAALAQMALKAGIDPGTVLASLTGGDVGIPQETALQMMGMPGATVTWATAGPSSRGWAESRRQIATVTPAGGAGGIPGVYSNTEDQAIINEGFRKAASTIGSAGRTRYAGLLTQGMQPEQAKRAVSGWTTDQAMKSRLSGEANLTERSVGQRAALLGSLAGYNAPATPSAGVGNADAGAGDFWDALAGLAGTLAQGTTTKPPAGNTTPIVTSGGFAPGPLTSLPGGSGYMASWLKYLPWAQNLPNLFPMT
jgi:hypothetical protein